MSTSANNVTRLLAELGSGDGSAVSRMFPLVYDELRALAASFFTGKVSNQTLQPTALVHEAYLRLVDQTHQDWTDRAHFMGVAAKAMRRLLIDHLRARQAQKRGGLQHRVTLDDSALAVSGAGILDALALEEALEKLGRLDERKARVVELRFFCGLTNESVAHVLGVSRATVVDDWSFARAWLAVELRDNGTE
ncbi:MAG: sigma-70 family RNA polymerase sigma factor [Phycisphaerae bacterium]